MSALKIQSLNCFYQKEQILKDLQLSLEKNEIICLLGESGCGEKRRCYAPSQACKIK